MICWEENFKSHLNTALSRDENALEKLSNASEPFYTNEVDETIYTKCGKAAAIDEVLPGGIKVAGEPMLIMLHKNKPAGMKRKLI